MLTAKLLNVECHPSLYSVILNYRPTFVIGNKGIWASVKLSFTIDMDLVDMNGTILSPKVRTLELHGDIVLYHILSLNKVLKEQANCILSQFIPPNIEL